MTWVGEGGFGIISKRHALMILITQAMSLRRAYQTVERATNNVEWPGDQASALYLVKGAFELFLTTVPPWLLAFLRAIGYTGNVKQGGCARGREGGGGRGGD